MLEQISTKPNGSGGPQDLPSREDLLAQIDRLRAENSQLLAHLADSRGELRVREWKQAQAEAADAKRQLAEAQAELTQAQAEATQARMIADKWKSIAQGGAKLAS